VFYLIVGSGTGYSLVRNTGAQKTGEGLLIHSQWPVKFYNALDRLKKLKMRNLEYMQHLAQY
jgi:hypothetical protein